MDPDFLHAINGDWDALLAAMRASRSLVHRTDASGMSVLHWVCLHQDVPTNVVVKVVFANPHAARLRNDAGHLPLDLALQAECGDRVLEILRAARLSEDGDAASDEPTADDDDFGRSYFHDQQQLHHHHGGYFDEQQQQQQQLVMYGNYPEDDDDDRYLARAPQQHHYAGYAPRDGERLGDERRPRGRSHSSGAVYNPVLLTEQRLQQREQDLISYATAEDSHHDDPHHHVFDPSGAAANNAPGGSALRPPALDEWTKGGDAKKPRVQSSFPPRWKQARHCHVCMTAFSFTKRRHHCRNCGQSVCGGHSTNRVALPKFGLLDPQRLCDKCFLMGHFLVPAAGSGSFGVDSLGSMADAKQQQKEADEDDPGCWQKKAAYEQCFDQWYKDKELRKEKALVDGIKSVMPADAKERWSANMDAQEKNE
ncbi:hypothetical protein PybrP1_003524 [[Pythium] brassicae (nom. inval.)]|nr:hypothetical protein PybrP1_003524 [[Pythium] brassicae (nom. inval.)]